MTYLWHGRVPANMYEVRIYPRAVFVCSLILSYNSVSFCLHSKKIRCRGIDRFFGRLFTRRFFSNHIFRFFSGDFFRRFFSGVFSGVFFRRFFVSWFFRQLIFSPVDRQGIFYPKTSAAAQAMVNAAILIPLSSVWKASLCHACGTSPGVPLPIQ